jgi:hypothetical protein
MVWRHLMENVKSSHGMGFSKLKKIEALPLHDVYIDEIKYTYTSLTTKMITL